MTRISLFSLSALVFALTACPSGQPIDNTETPSDDALDITVNESYGALTEADEDEAFGDEELTDDPSLSREGDEVDDGSAVTDAEDALTTAGVPLRRLTVSVVWGHLLPDFEETEVTDWSGTISVENAVLRVRRLIQFDANDSISRPRSSAREVAFTSHTKPAYDGLLLEVVTRANGEAPVLSMDTPAFTGSLVLDSDTPLSGRQVLENGNAIVYHIFRADADADCKNGLMGGRYVKTRETDDGRAMGRFKGRYVSAGGTVAGHLRGVWGERVNGSKVLFAKVIGHDGQFKGILAGKYGDGVIKGRYLGLNKEVKGAFKGFYRSAPERDGGFFRARWSEKCGELPSEGELDNHDEDNDEVDEELSDLLEQEMDQQS